VNGVYGERPGGTGPGDNYRLYQVPGASHVWAEQVAPFGERLKALPMSAIWELGS
jgi:hypothetical protein